MTDGDDTGGTLSVALANLGTKLLDKLPVRTLNQLDAMLAGWLESKSMGRKGNLNAVLHDAATSAEDQQIDLAQANEISLHAGVPWFEKASLAEDETLRKRWAELFLSLLTEEHPEYSAGATYVRILAELDPWDCKVLDYMVKEGGLSKSLFREVSFWYELIQAVPDPAGDAGRTMLSVEKLIRCGCLEKNDTHVSRRDQGITMYGGIVSYVSLTVTGLKFHIAATRSEPGWLRKDDEFRDDMHPIHPVPKDERTGVSSMAEQDRFERFVEEFDPVHYRLLDESKGDLRIVRDTIRMVDGEPRGAVKIEGRESHPVKPGLMAWRELYESGLVNIPNPEIVMSQKAYELGGLTPLGLRFLSFIEGRTPSLDFGITSAP